MGISKVSQLDDNLKSLELAKKWTPELEKSIREVLGNDPTTQKTYVDWSLIPQGRDVSLTYGLKK